MKDFVQRLIKFLYTYLLLNSVSGVACELVVRSVFVNQRITERSGLNHRVMYV